MSEVDLNGLAAEITKLALSPRARHLVLLEGPMGAGKTQFVQLAVQGLGGQWAGSPTFAIHQIYPTPQGEIDHFDLFRLKNDADLESSGFWDVLSKDNGLIFVEWADRLIGDWAPSGWTKLQVRLTPITNQPSLRKLEISRRP